MAFPDVLAELLAVEGTVVPEGFGDRLTASYNEDAAAALAESNTTIAARDEMIRNLKAAAAIDTIPPTAGDPVQEEDELDPDAPLDANFDDFFGESGDEDDPDNRK